jgi:WD40 repeat protein
MMYDLEKQATGCINERAHTLDTEAHSSLIQYTDGFDVNAICPMQENVLATGGDDGVIKLWDKRCLDNSYQRPIGGFIGH